MRDDGEPISSRRLDRRAAEPGALWAALFGAVFFSGVVLVNGVLAILLIGLMQGVGWWEVSAIEGGPGLTTEWLRGPAVRPVLVRLWAPTLAQPLR